MGINNEDNVIAQMAALHRETTDSIREMRHIIKAQQELIDKLISGQEWLETEIATLKGKPSA